MKVEIRPPQTEEEWKSYYALRYQVLREPLGQPVGSERNENDSIGQHFALFENNEIKAIARLDEAGENISQVRFVAVDPDSRGLGYGRVIMDATELKSKADGNNKMILHARDYAVDFYLKLDYRQVGKSYKLFDVLQHYLMEKDY
jgi:predicted GNAT family N-acyltransferase